MLFLDREGKHPVGDINCSGFLEQMNNCEMFLVAVYVYEEMRTIFWPWINLECPVLPSIAYSWGSCWHSHPRGQGRRSSRQLHACRKDRESWSGAFPALGLKERLTEGTRLVAMPSALKARWMRKALMLEKLSVRKGYAPGSGENAFSNVGKHSSIHYSRMRLLPGTGSGGLIKGLSSMPQYQGCHLPHSRSLEGPRASWEKSTFRTGTEEVRDEPGNLWECKNLVKEGWGCVKGWRSQLHVVPIGQIWHYLNIKK